MSAAPMQLPLDMIRLGERVRRPRESRIAAIAADLRDQGDIRTPLTVAPVGGKSQAYDLVTGAATFLALKRLGRELAPCRIRRLSASERRAAEIDDNLVQDGTTVLERAQLLAARKAIYEAEHPETANGGDRRSQARVDQMAETAIRSPAFSAWAATRYGRAERTVRTHAAIGATLDRDAADALGESESADKVSELTALSRLEAGVQRQVAGLLTREADPATSVAEALAILGEKVEQLDLFSKFTSNLIGYWGRLGAREKTLALRKLAELELPKGVRIVFDGEGDG